ncbi:MAG: ABC transporter substrate-binding protein [Deltaproteobacteria bacterium]|nr:ABC transporter substrate-binding protein [Deltaproteobacteria bacterium]
MEAAIMRKTTIGLMLVVAILALHPSARAEVGVTDTTILVGTSTDFSGPLVFAGTESMVGVESYFEYVNSKGGVHGRKLAWKWYDQAYKPQEAVMNVKRLVEQDGVFCILINEGTATVAAVIPYLEQNKIPLIFPFQGDSAYHGRKYIFNTFAYYDTQTRIITQWLIEKKGMKKIGIIYQDDVYGQMYLDDLKKELAAHGLSLAAAESVKRGAVDVAAQVAKLAAADLDACLMALVPGPGAQVLKEAQKVGWKKAKIVSAGPLTDEKFLILSGGAGEGVLGLALWPDPVHSQLPAMKQYREIVAKYRPGHEPNRYSLFGYFYAMLFVEGLKGAGRDLTREGLIRSLESIKNWKNGIINPVSFSPEDHHATDEGFMVEVRDNRFVPISGWLSVRGGKIKETPLQQ